MFPRWDGALVKPHLEELRHEAAAERLAAGGDHRRSLRDAAGWFLVGLGLRLVQPCPRAAAA